MNKITKVCLSLALIFLCSGVAFVIAGLVTGASFQELQEIVPDRYLRIGQTTEYSAETTNADYEFANVSKLDLEIGIAETRIETWPGDTVLVSVENITKSIKCEEKNGKLKIKYENNDAWGINMDTPQITIQLPDGMAYDECAFDVGVGSLEVENLNTNELDVECGVGKAVIEGTVKGKCKIKNGVGSVELILKGNEDQFDYKIDCGIGEVRLGDRSYNGLDKSKKIDNGAGRTIDIDCGIGSVGVEFN